METGERPLTGVDVGGDTAVEFGPEDPEEVSMVCGGEIGDGMCAFRAVAETALLVPAVVVRFEYPGL
jgi:hypothetical protein